MILRTASAVLLLLFVSGEFGNGHWPLCQSLVGLHSCLDRVLSLNTTSVCHTGLHGVRCQNEPPSPETKSTFELAKETTIQKHTGVNVTTGQDIVPSANTTSNATGNFASSTQINGAASAVAAKSGCLVLLL